MRKLLLLAVLGIGSLIAAPAKAQVSLSVNIGVQPQWGPTGYNHVDYYYLPEVESYYYVPSRQFIYFSGNRWIHSRSLPSRYRHYNLYTGRKVVINSPRPYLHHTTYRTQYSRSNYRPGRPARVVVRNHYKADTHKSYKSKGRDKHRVINDRNRSHQRGHSSNRSHR